MITDRIAHSVLLYHYKYYAVAQGLIKLQKSPVISKLNEKLDSK